MTDTYRWNDYRQPEQFYLNDVGPDALVAPDQIALWAQKLWDGFELEKARLEKIDKWYKGNQDNYNITNPDRELIELLELAKTPWLGLVVTTVAQAMYVDGFKSPDTGKTVEGPWKTWHANRMQSRQVAIHRAALGYGYSYLLVERGASSDGVRSIMRGVSPKRAFAVYDDPANDDYPRYAIKVDAAGDNTALVYLYDDTFKHTLKFVDGGTRWLILSSTPHFAGVVPLVRFTNNLDLDGNTPGEVEPFVGAAKRIDKTTFDRLMVQHFNSWKKMWISGLTNVDTDEDAQKAKTRLRHDDTLVFESVDTRIGTVEETSLEGFIASVQADIDHLASLSQMPAHLLTGNVANLAADAIDMANRPLTQKVYERQMSFGQSYNLALRLAAFLEGDLAAAGDIMASVTWQDMEIRSLAQAADALGKMATQLAIPRKALWRKIPGVTQLDAEEWENMALDDDPLSVYLRSLDKTAVATGPGVAGNDPSVPQPGVDNAVKPAA